MKDLIVKYLYLSYYSLIAGKEYKILRATTVIVPVFCLAIIATLLFNFGWVFWLIFSILILITFPILKVNWLNLFTIVAVPLAIGGAQIFDYEWWEPLPFLYFGIGIMLKRTKFIFLNVKYADLQDWQQKLQYLYINDDYKDYDETEPEFEKRYAAINEFEGIKELKFGARSNVNILPFIIPIASAIIMIIILIVFQDGIERFPDNRGF